MNNEEQHIDVREKLSKLPRVKARDGFENELLRRINLLEPLSPKSPAQKSSFWEILFGKKALVWTIPATSLVVVGIVFFAVYLSMYKSDANNTATDKQTFTNEFQKEQFPSGSNSQETVKNNIPGKDIVNDLEIGKSTEVERRDVIDKGLNETYIQPAPKPFSNPKENVIDSKKETTIYDKADETGKTGVLPNEKDGSNNKGVLKDERKTEETKKAKEPEKKISSPLIKEGEKNKTEKNEVDSKEKLELKQKEDARIKDEAKKKEDARIKDEAKKKEDARLKEENRIKEENRAIEELRKKEEAKKKEEARKKEEAKINEEARKKEEARKREEAKQKEEAKKQEEAKKKELEKLKEQIKEN